MTNYELDTMLNVSSNINSVCGILQMVSLGCKRKAGQVSHQIPHTKVTYHKVTPISKRYLFCNLERVHEKQTTTNEFLTLTRYVVEAYVLISNGSFITFRRL